VDLAAAAARDRGPAAQFPHPNCDTLAVAGTWPQSRSAMRRREFIAILGGAATWPLAAFGQQPERMRRIGVLMAHPESDPEFQDYVSAFRDGLRKLGWTEGRNIQ